jgi:hypothetical protein
MEIAQGMLFNTPAPPKRFGDLCVIVVGADNNGSTRSVQPEEELNPAGRGRSKIQRAGRAKS